MIIYINSICLNAVIMEHSDLASFLGIASGILGTLVMICIGVGLTTRLRHNGQSQCNRPPNPSAVDNKKNLSYQQQDQVRYDKEDDNPDLIPDNIGEYLHTLSVYYLIPTH